MDTSHRTAEGLIDAEIAYPDGTTGTISATPEHPFFAPELDKYRSLRWLEPGTRLHTERGGEAILVGKTWRQAEAAVFNFEVEGQHNYFVKSDGAAVLTHNASCPRFQGPKPTYDVNPAHLPGHPGCRPNKTPLPADAKDVFKRAVPDDALKPRNWYGMNASGVIYRFSGSNDGTAHFSGMEGDGIRNITRYALCRLGR